MLLSRLDHVAINVKNLNITFDWYSKIFKFKMIKQWNTTWMFGDERMRIGAFQRPQAKTLTSEDIDKNYIVIQHFAFGTDESGLQAAIKELDDLKVAHSEIEDSGIAKSIFLTDPDGHSVEITTYYA